MPRLLHTRLLSLLSLTPQGAAQPITTQYDTQNKVASFTKILRILATRSSLKI